MAFEARLLAGLFLALGLAYVATPVAIRVAARLNFYDRPVGYKGHGHPTPYLGGTAVVTGFLAAALLLGGSLGRTLPFIGGIVVMWAVGTVDDRRSVSPLVRVVIE